MVDFIGISKREYDELGFLYEQRYGPYKPFKEGIVVDGDINPYIRQLMDVTFENEVEKIKIEDVEKFLFNKLNREEARKILTLLLKFKVISEQGNLLMNKDEYTRYIESLLCKEESNRNPIKDRPLRQYLIYGILIIISICLFIITNKILGITILIPAFVLIISLYFNCRK
ncbi:hypothetical protein [Clostridium sp. E02]|uniref:hypothetical protein n=1 Tax=Clostridium sp. E02 TaxID=2487134 RepID=UPI000F51B74F|nr:hypothetical protein [Clostridium sp. E02]